MEKLLYFCLLLTIFTPAFFTNEEWLISRVAASFIIVCILFLKKVKINKTACQASIFLFLITVSGILFSAHFYNTIYLLNWYFTLILIYIFFLNFKKITFLKFFYISAFITSIISIISFFAQINFLSLVQTGLNQKLWFVNPNYMGAFLLSAVIWGILKSKKIKKFHLTNLIIFAGIIISYNRAAWGIFILMYFIIYLKNKYKKAVFFISVLTVLVVNIIIINGWIEEPSLIHRTYFFNIGLRQFIDNPVTGVESGQYRYFYGKYIKDVYEPGIYDRLPATHFVHNDYIQFLAENGLIGVGIIFFFLWWVYCQKKNLIFYYGIMVLLMSSINHFLFFEEGIIIFLTAAALYSKEKMYRLPFKKWVLNVFILIIIITNLFLFSGAYGFENVSKGEKAQKFLAIRPGYSFLQYNTGAYYYNEGNKEKAFLFFEKAINNDPYYGRFYKGAGFSAGQSESYEKCFDYYKKAVKYLNFDEAFEASSEALFFASKIDNKEMIDYFLKTLKKNMYLEKHKELYRRILFMI
ncbi:MAG: O-antigen ligase family protein [Candidatus Muiribacteriota bacterium]